MTLKTSFFNKAIYKSTVKRYAWGSFLYFILLFISTVLSLFLNIEQDFSHMPKDHFIDYSVILHGQYITVPILLTIVVPTIVSLLIFRFIHAKKQAIFTHSIPVSKKANYFSSLLAGFTLMLVPVILNSILLMLTSITSYADFFTIKDCLIWAGYNLISIFMMFSIAVFSATITGNSFAMIVINILVHSILFIIYASFTTMSDVFLYGYSGADEIFDVLMRNNFTVVVYGFMDRYFRSRITNFQYMLYLLVSGFTYVGSYFIYKLRKPETASDVAGFKCLNYIFKYLATFLITMFGFTIFSHYISDNIIVFSIIIFFISVIIYFASEMILKKTVNVFYSWKGYIGFALVFLLIITVYSQTSFFGFETRIPERNDILKATMYSYYFGENEPFTENPEIIDKIVNNHKNFISEDIPKLKTSGSIYREIDHTRLHIKYVLKNGKILHRTYFVATTDCVTLMNDLYTYDDYKKLCEIIFIDNNLINNLYLNYETPIKETNELLNVIREDVLKLTYEDLHNLRYTNNEYSIRIEYKEKEIIATKGVEPSVSYRREYYDINPSFTNTIKWLTEKGYIKN